MPEQIGSAPRVETRKCRSINVLIGWLATYDEVSTLVNWITGEYSDMTRRRPDRKGPSGQYNCHGLTFVNRRGRLPDSSEVKVVLEEDEYYEIPSNLVKPGDIAVYYTSTERSEIDHTGVVIEVERPAGHLVVPRQTIWVLSKWGYGPEVEHHAEYCPYPDATTIIYMREGKNDGLTDYHRN